MAVDPDYFVRCDAAEALATWLEQTDGFGRLEVALDWTLSPLPQLRVAMARDLSYGLPLLAADMIVEHLARDRDRAVRIAALEAAKKRLAENQPVYAGILSRLLADEERQVRKAARRALQRSGLIG